jgi:curved DNA-binding protein CbpA
MKAKFQEIKPAYEALRALSQVKTEDKPIRPFQGQLNAKYRYVLLQQGLKTAVDIFAEEIQNLIQDHTETVDDKQLVKDVVALRAAEKKLLLQEIEVEGTPLKASELGQEFLDAVDGLVLADLGPFLEWDLA